MAVASKSEDGRAFVVDDGFAASFVDGQWVPGIQWQVDETKDFHEVPPLEAEEAAKAARMALSSLPDLAR